MANEAQYLQGIQANFCDLAKQIRALNENDEDYSQKVMDIIQQAIDFEEKLRTECELGVRFNVIPNQIKVLYDKCDHEFGLDREHAASKLERVHDLPDEDELTVYVYLFNARAENNIKAWSSLVAPLSIKNYSVNRPIYENKFHVDELIRNKPSPAMHAYLEVIIKKSDIITEGEKVTDNLGNPLLRVKENTITFDRICFFHCLAKKYKLQNGNALKFIEV